MSTPSPEYERGLDHDPLHGDALVAQYFGDAHERVASFAELLADQGVLRGLIGPRELVRIWERHILNSAAVVPFLGSGPVADVGSGAGLPGLVIAAMEPAREVVLVEPMERRSTWLQEAADACGLSNVTVVRARAEECAGSVSVPVVTARAVASIDKLIKWCMPLVAPGGHLALLKGRSVHAELDKAKYVLRKHGLVGSVHEATTIAGVEPTTVVTLRQASS